jgi:hypothetical protein
VTTDLAANLDTALPLMCVYVAGPCSGLPLLNFPAFRQAAADLRAAGFSVVNPAELCPDEAMDWADAMRIDIAALVTLCRGVATLPGWEASKGASLEVHIARELGMVVNPVETWLGSASLLTAIGARAAA